jgi:tRNA 2-thiouridine synthesizing protein A
MKSWTSATASLKPVLVDARGLRCPLPLVRARQALVGLASDEALVVLATDPEAPIDLAALAADVGGGNLLVAQIDAPPRRRNVLIKPF